MSEMKSYLGWKVDYTVPAGEPSYTTPDSVSWKIFKNPVTASIAGVCAVLLEFADARIRSGVWDHSVFPTDPFGRAERTRIASHVGVYGPQSAARRVIQGVTNMHAKVSGTTPDGKEYKALDTELLDWVAATAAYGYFMAYSTYASKLSKEEERRFFSEGREVSKLYGVQRRPADIEDFHAMMAKLEPGFEPHPINLDFLAIVKGSGEAKGFQRVVRVALANAAVEILPRSVREVLGLGSEYDLKPFQRWLVRTLAWYAETFPDRNSAAAQGCARLGLPRDFLWKSEKAQTRLLEGWKGGVPVEA